MDNFEKILVLISFITSFFGVFVLNGIIIAVPSIGAEFGMNNVVQNWIPTLFVFVVTMATLPSGQISSKFGSKKSYIIGNILLVLGFFISCIAFSSETFLFSRIVQGLGVGLSNVAEMTILVLAISKENRGKALGIIVAGVYLGTSLSPVICGFLVQNLGWRSIFYFSIPFMVICILLMMFKIEGEWKTSKDDRIDIIGSILYVCGIFFFIYGFTDLISFIGKIFVVIGTILLILFGVYELRQMTPVFKVGLLKNKSFSLYNIAGLCGFFSVMALSTIFNYYFQYVKGWDPQLTGLILLVSPIIMSITAPNAGRLSDRIHPQKIASIGMVITAAALVILVFLEPNTPIYIIVIAMALQALGMGLFSSPNMNAIVSAVPQEYAPHASAAQLTVRAIGQTMSLGLMTLVFSWIMGNLILATEHAGMITQASGIICAVCALACIIAVVCSLYGMKLEGDFTLNA